MEELRTNAAGQLGRRYPDRASKLESKSPDLLFPTTALDAYLRPATSPATDLTCGWPGFGRGESSYARGKGRNEGRGDLEGLATACERYFEWGTKDLVAKKFSGESVGLFGAELLNEAREAIRHAGRTSRSPSPPTLSQPSPIAGPSRITSFFPATLPHSTQLKTMSAAAFSSRTTRSNVPNHIAKIHSTRSDPTNPGLNEYRISFNQAPYVTRCHDTMAGSRADPRDLSLAERQDLGLVEREDDSPPMASQVASPKDEIRTWMPEYLVRGAWPELVQTYEETLNAKLTAKGKGRTKSARTRTATHGDPERFAQFFTQNQRPSSPVEAVEVLESPRQRRSSVILSPTPRPAKEISPSLPNLLDPPSPRVHRDVLISATRRSRSIAPVSAASAATKKKAAFAEPAIPSRATRSTSGKVLPQTLTKKKSIIDLTLSSDDDQARPLRRSPARANPGVTARAMAAKSPSPLKEQPRLNFAVVSKPTRPAKSREIVVLYETEEVERINITGRRSKAVR